MKQYKSLVVCCLLLILFTTATRAQYYYGDYINQTVILRSDLPSKSVLVSNLLADRVGDMSPVIGAANWVDSGRQLECRSLIKFNYVFLPDIILEDPSLITTAELILTPVSSIFADDDRNKPGRILVRRIVDNWEDSSTMWINQPLADSIAQVRKTIKVKNKEKQISVDVTKLVKSMLRNGNNGFMICPEKEKDELMASGQLFISPKNEDEELRPLLVINYRRMFDHSISFKYWNDMSTAKDYYFTGMQPRSGANYPVMEPVREPVSVPPPANTNPVKD
ncbi:MAG: DNRLRE domain-containing protein [Chitinophagaceae bacterium]